MSEQLIKTPGVFGDGGNFLLERELGQGGMGGVYMGRDKMLDRPVAVKVMLRQYGSDAEFVEKFKKEAQSAAKLIHPNIAQIYSYGICDGMPYIVLELVAGGSLYSIMNNAPGKTDIQRILKIGQQVAMALQCATDQGFVHGDVKPENVLLDANGNAKLVDFGLAGMQKNTDEIWGTPYYISPEKVRKEPVDFRADMYSLGGTLYHALTGVAPFEGEDAVAVVKKRFEGAPRKPSEIRPEITPAVDQLVLKMLALNREDRFPSFEALLTAFKDVLANGLTQNLSASATAKLPASAAKAPSKAVGPRRVSSVRTRRAMMMKRKGVTVGKVSPETAADAEDGEKPASDDKDDEEEGGGNLAVKVILFIVGGILALAAVIGGLIWFKASSAAAEREEIRQQIQGGYDKADEAIRDTVQKAVAFADEFDTFAHRAIEECQKPTDELKKILEPEYAAMLKPGPSAELLAAIASTNAAATPAAAPAPAPAAPTNAVAAAATTNAPPVATNAPAAKADAKKEAPAKKTDAKKTDAKKADAKKTDAKKADAKKAEPPKKKEEPKKEEPKKETPQIVLTMNELWARAYGCEASAIRIRVLSRQIVTKSHEAEALREVTKENMEKLAELSRALVDLFEQMKVSKDVENVKKGISYIKDRGKKAVEQTVKRLRIEKLEADRKAKREQQEAAEKARLQAKAEAHAKQVEADCKAVTDTFDQIAAMGSFRQLDWKGALRQLEAVKADLKSPEGQLAADLAIRKVNDMKKVQDVFVSSMRDHVFRGKLRGYKVTSVSDKEIQLARQGHPTRKITWQKFLKDYPGNLNELINVYIVNGREKAKPRLNLRDWADAMTGASLILQLVCSEVNGAVEKATQLAQEAVKKFPDYRTTAQKIFPDVKFAEAEE